MILAAIDWLSISINLLLVIFVIVCLLMTLVILMQRPKQEGLGAAFGGGVTDQVFGARTTDVLQRGTVYMGSLFFILSITLAVLIGQQNKVAKTVLASDTAPKVEEAKAPEVVTPKSLSEELPAETPAPTPSPAPAEAPADASPAPEASAPTPAPEAAAPAPEATPVAPVPTEPAPPQAPGEPVPAGTPAGN